VAAILANPRYTGRQVWNRQPTDRHLDPQGELITQQEVQRGSPSSHWAISRTVVHPPLVSEEQFVRVQAVHAAPAPADGPVRTYARPDWFTAGSAAGSGSASAAWRVAHRYGPRRR